VTRLSARLVLLPGMHGTGELFAPLIESLPRSLDTVVVSLPCDQVLSHDSLLEHVEHALPRAGDYVLLAESFSGAVAIRHAAKKPRRLRGLILCAGFASNPLPAHLRWARVLAKSATFRSAPPRALVRSHLVGGAPPGALVDQVIAAVRKVDPAVMASRMRQVLDVDVRPELAQIDVPILYLAASSDRLVGRRGLAQVERAARDCSSVVLDGPHLLLQTRPSEAAREIVAFVRALPAARATS
jgi:pimeloyl-ACP methyl ester carboxylesterase